MVNEVEKLFGSALRAKVIKLFLTNKDKEISLDEAAKKLKNPKPNTKRELQLLRSIGVLETVGKNKAASYRLDLHSPLLPGLELLLSSSYELDKEIEEKIKKAVKKLKLLVLSGKFTKNHMTEADILIVAEDFDDRKVRNAVSSIEAIYGKELGYAVFTEDDFEYRMNMHDRLLKDIFDYSYRVVVDKLGLQSKI